VLRRQTEGSVICTSCGVLVGVKDPACYNCGRRNPGLWGFGPSLRALGNDLGFVPFVIGACGFVYILSLIASNGRIGMGGLMSFGSPTVTALQLFGASGGIPVFGFGHWWTLFSAVWLHGSALHILFNMMWVRDLAPATANIYGPGRMVIIYTVSGVAGFALSSFAFAYMPAFPILHGSPLTVGASGAIFGLLGSLVYYGRRGGSSALGSQALTYAVMMGVFGLVMQGVDNFSHLGGFFGGYVAGLVLDPLKPERIDHIAIAVGCLAISVLSIVYSFITVSRLA
jgi:rhomboid protease GluP